MRQREREGRQCLHNVIAPLTTRHCDQGLAVPLLLMEKAEVALHASILRLCRRAHAYHQNRLGGDRLTSKCRCSRSQG
jgi:hypothetical protein